VRRSYPLLGRLRVVGFVDEESGEDVGIERL
jgi:hypothetical protein